MSTADLELVALRAEAKRLKEVMKAKDQLLASKDANLVSKDRVIACKDDVLMHISKELQQYRPGPKTFSASSGAAPGERETVGLDFWQQQQHNSTLDAAKSLDQDAILDHVLGYVGGGDHLFISGVSRRWGGRCLRHCKLSCTSSNDKKFVTRHRSALMSKSRLQLALSSGLVVEDWSMSKLSYADVICTQSTEPEQVMTLLRLHGVPWDAMLCNCAALHARLPLLQWLHSSSCPWSEPAVLHNAARGGAVAMLEWLLTVTAAWTSSAKQQMLYHAAWCDKLDAAQWLRARGAAWPEKFAGQYNGAKAAAATVHQCWSLSAVQWVIAAGSGWLDWKCGDYAANKFSSLAAKQHATAVLKWAHSHGCPCTCGHRKH
jgi:hypothetical protein